MSTATDSGVKPDSRIIHSFDKGLQVLELVAEGGGEIGLTELTQRLGWDKSSVFRLLTTLIRRGYVEQDRSTKRYRLGFRILHLERALFRSLDLPQMAREVLTELARETGEAAHLAVLRQDEVVIIAQRESPERVAVNAQVGTMEPLHCTALGKAMLMQMTDAAVKTVIDRLTLTSFTVNTITSPQWLLETVQKSRRLGYALDDEEFTPGVRCISAPAPVPATQHLYAIGISGPASRVVAGRIPLLAEHVVKAAKDFAEQFEQEFAVAPTD